MKNGCDHPKKKKIKLILLSNKVIEYIYIYIWCEKTQACNIYIYIYIVGEKDQR